MAPIPIRFELHQRDQLLVVAILGALGGAVGWFFPALAGLFRTLPWVPLQGPIELLTMITASADRWVVVGIFAAAAMVIGLLIVAELAEITISCRDVVVHNGSKRQRFARSQVAELTIEDKRLILRDAADIELLRSEYYGKRGEILRAARDRGWPVVEPGLKPNRR